MKCIQKWDFIVKNEPVIVHYPKKFLSSALKFCTNSLNNNMENVEYALHIHLCAL
jgi:hypothetical protein